MTKQPVTITLNFPPEVARALRTISDWRNLSIEDSIVLCMTHTLAKVQTEVAAMILESAKPTVEEEVEDSFFKEFDAGHKATLTTDPKKLVALKTRMAASQTAKPSPF